MEEDQSMLMPASETLIDLRRCKEVIERKRGEAIDLVKVKMFPKLYPDSNGV